MALNQPKREGAAPPPKTSTKGKTLPPEQGLNPASFPDDVPPPAAREPSKVPEAETIPEGEVVFLRVVPVNGAKSNFVWVRKHPVVDPLMGGVTRYRSGKCMVGETFVWRGTERNWPARCERVDGPPYDEDGYERQVTVLEPAVVMTNPRAMAQARGRAASGAAMRAPERLPQPAGLGGSSLPL